jgi:hypothetical protein
MIANTNNTIDTVLVLYYKNQKKKPGNKTPLLGGPVPYGPGIPAGVPFAGFILLDLQVAC